MGERVSRIALHWSALRPVTLHFSRSRRSQKHSRRAPVPSYFTFNLGAERSFKAGPSGEWKVRVDIVNLADKVYELRGGSGVGVGAAQFGPRRGFFGSVSYEF